MAWVDPSAEIQSDYPARASSVRQIQENIAAMADGHVSAPRVQARDVGGSGMASENGLFAQIALVSDDNSPSGGGKLIRAVYAPAHTDYPVLTVIAGTLGPLRGNGVVIEPVLITMSGTFTLAVTIEVAAYTGTLTFKSSHRVSGAGVTSEMRVVKNTVQQEVWSTSSTSAVERSRDIAVVPGDVITWEHRRTAGSGLDTSQVFPIGEFADKGWIDQPTLLMYAEA
jgi:hypothetical protein